MRVLLLALLAAAAGSPPPSVPAVPPADPGPPAAAVYSGTAVAGQDAPAPGGTALTGAELDALTARVADQLRCPICRNQSVLESPTELAREMQSVIRERLASGESPDEVKAYFVARYGEWILLMPTARGVNLAVYLLPPLLLVAGALLLRGRIRRWRERREAPFGSAGSGAAPGPAGAAPGGDGGVPREAPPEAAAGELSEEDEAWLREAIRQA